MRHSSALSTQLLITSAGLRIGLTTMTTWFLLPPIPKIEFVPSLFGCKDLCCNRSCFSQKRFYIKWFTAFWSHIHTVSVAQKYGIRSHIHTVSGYQAAEFSTPAQAFSFQCPNRTEGSLRIDINSYPPWYGKRGQLDVSPL